MVARCLRLVSAWGRAVVVLGAAAWAAAPGRAAINLDFAPNNQTVVLGATVSVQFGLVSDNGSNQLAAAAELVLGWNPGVLKLTGISQSGATPLLSSGFPFPDPYGLNEVSLPQDGNAYYQAYAQLGSPIVAPPGGVLLTTFKFQALAPTTGTLVQMLVQGGNPVLHTRVFDGTLPNTIVTGTLENATVVITPEPGTAGLLLAFAAYGIRRRI